MDKCERTVVFSDAHIGSTVALWPGEHRVEGGGSYKSNKFQRWLFQCWNEAMADVSAMTPKPVIVLNGDMIQGVNFKDGQLITTQVNVQVDAALRLLNPLKQAASRLYYVRGTEWHEGKAADNVEQMARQLGAVVDPATKQWSWWELYRQMGDAVVHYAHHIGMSSVPHYEATVPLRDTLMLLAELARFFGKAAPDVRLTVRSHRHRYIRVEAPPNLNCVVTPSWQLKTAFAHKKATAMLPQIGYVVIDLDDNGDPTPHKKIFDLPRLHVEC